MPQRIDGFEVRDFRNKQFFMLDDVYLNGYAKHLGPHATCVYLSLCRHADKDQTAFPSQELIGQEHGIGERTVRDKVKLLCEWGIIAVVKERSSKGTFQKNVYYLLDKSKWKSPPATAADGKHPPANDDIIHRQQLPDKETHTIKETHTLSRAREGLFKITETDMQELAERYGVPLSFVQSKHDDLINYCERTGKKYNNYLAALRNFVKQDAMKIRKESQNGKRRISFIDPS